MGEVAVFDRRTPPLDALLGTVEDAMTPEIVVLDPEMRAGDAATILEKAGVAGGPVVREGHVVGMVSFTDLEPPEVRLVHQRTGPFLRGERHLVGLAVQDVMSREVVFARTEWPLTRAVELMHTAGVNRLPVLDRRDRPVGILARDDVIRAVARRSRATGQHPSMVRGPAHRPRLIPD